MANEYITNPQGYVTSGAKSANYGESFLEGNSTDWGTLWNTAWNAGYNNSNNSSNPYSGQSGNGYDIASGYTAGQQQYLKDKGTTGPGGANPPAPTGGNTKTGGNTDRNTGSTNNGIPPIDMSFYGGWNDQNAIAGDWANTWKQKTGSGGSGGGPSAEELALRGLKSTYESAYNPIFQQLDSMAGLIPQQQEKRLGNLQDLYTSQQGELGTNMQGSLGQLDTARGQVASQKAQSIRDLQQQMNQMSKAGGMQLGSAGAGDSSAARMYNFALSKAAGQNSADVSNQANNMYGQIQGQEQQIRATYDDQIAKLGTWKATQTDAITQWADDQLGQINSAKLNATGQKAAALAASEAGIINNALSQLQKIDDQITNWNQGIQTWALNRMATIDDAKAKISGYGKYTPTAITTNELQGLNNVQGADSGGMTGFYNAQKKKETDFLSNYK